MARPEGGCGRRSLGGEDRPCAQTPTLARGRTASACIDASGTQIRSARKNPDDARKSARGGSVQQRETSKNDNARDIDRGRWSGCEPGMQETVGSAWPVVTDRLSVYSCESTGESVLTTWWRSLSGPLWVSRR